MPSFTVSRRDLFRGAAAASGLFLTRRVYGQTAPSIEIKKLSDHVSLLTGDGGNIAIVNSGDGLLLVDSGLPTQGADLLKALTGQPVRTVFNTHWHFDHSGGNVALGNAGAKIFAHENVKKRLTTKQTIEAFNMKFEPTEAPGIPSTTFTDPGSMTVGKETLRYARVAPAHTDGDTYILFEKANVLHTGDLMFNGFYPFIDYSTGGTLPGMSAASQKLLTVADAKTRIIPGHGPLASRDDLKAYSEMLATANDRLTALAKQGKTVDEAVAAAPLKDLDAKWGGGAMKPEAFVKVAYTSILRMDGKA